jgi:cell division protein FtsA
MASRFIVGLDIGTCAIKVAVVEHKGEKMVLHSIFKEPSTGLRRGSVFDPAETAPAVSRALDSIKKISKSALRNIYVNLNTHQARVQSARGIVAVSRVDNEIFEDDVERAKKASQAVSALPNYVLVHNLTKEYIVDGVPEIESPLGLSGSRLEVQSLIVDAFAPHVKNAIKAVEMAGGDVSRVVFNPLASARAALSRNQKNLGVAVVDIGFATTGLAVYEENKLVGMKVIPLGGANVTNDLAVGLKIPVASAENLKLNFGYAYSSDVGSKEVVDIKKFHPEARGTISRRFISEIIESRLAEILELVNNELKSWGKSGRLAGGVVFVGGGAKMPGLTELGKNVLRLATQIGFTVGSDWFEETTIHSPESLEDPEFVNSLGLVLWGADEEKLWEGSRVKKFDFKNVFKNFLS